MWVSNNGGELWTEHMVEAPSSSQAISELLSVEATAEGFVALGAYQRSDGHFQLVSSDGRAWKLSQSGPDLAALTRSAVAAIEPRPSDQPDHQPALLFARYR